ncbi:MAG: HeH/LEM domain-containing protein [Pseudomonas sp.]|nr:HeH/LEM domain-containing protein [Pseudomonas sp.]
MQCATVRIKADKSDANPLGFVIINTDDFDAKKHDLFDDAPEEVKPLTVPQIKEALTALKIEIPEKANKAELQALLDGTKPVE